jgi:hypothetical protein
LYANGDPVNRIDPLGRAAMLEVGSIDAIIGTVPVPALIELAGGTAAEIALQMQVVATDIAEITFDLAQEVVEEAAGDYAAAWNDLVQAVNEYKALLAEESSLCGITRAITCGTVGLVAADILEHSSIPKWIGHTVEAVSTGYCAVKLEIVK